MWDIRNVYHREITYPHDAFESSQLAYEFLDSMPDQSHWVVEEIKDDNETVDRGPAPMSEYLVFEGREVPEETTFRGALTDKQIRERAVMRTLFDVYPMLVRARDEQHAAMQAMALTRRISRYAIMPAVVFDFGANLEDPEPRRLELGS